MENHKPLFGSSNNKHKMEKSLRYTDCEATSCPISQISLLNKRSTSVDAEIYNKLPWTYLELPDACIDS